MGEGISKENRYFGLIQVGAEQLKLDREKINEITKEHTGYSYDELGYMCWYIKKKSEASYIGDSYSVIEGEVAIVEACKVISEELEGTEIKEDEMSEVVEYMKDEKASLRKKVENIRKEFIECNGVLEDSKVRKWKALG